MINTLRQLVRDTRSQKLRTLLTLFGITWGTAAVSLLLAFGEGFHQHMANESVGMGNAVVIGWPSRTSIPFEGLGKGRRILLTDSDVDLLRQKAWGLGAISAEYTDSFKLQYGPTVLSIPVSGVEPEFREMRNLIPDVGGRFINRIDMEKRRRVIFLGTDLAENVFGETPPVGQTVQLDGSPFLVVGVLKEKNQNSNYGGPDTNRAFIPGPAFRALTGQEYIDNFVFNAADVNRTGELTEEIRSILAAKHRFDPADSEAVSFWDTTEGAQFLETFMVSFRLFLGILGCLTLVVGGIGVSNIMNVVVEERTREIGVKMAIGAKPRTILGMFLMETLAMTAVGGALGLGITVGICALFPLLDMDAYVGAPGVSPAMALATVTLLGLIGFISGFFPARTAANLDPVVAMKR